MVQYAIFLSRNETLPYYPTFEIIYLTELIILLVDIFLCPIHIWITWNAEPLHRNLRYAFIFCIGHLGLLNFARIPLMWVQQYVENWEDHRWLLLIFSYIRFEAFAFFPWMYEKQDRNTVFVIVIIFSIFEAVAIIPAYLVLYQDIFATETVKILRTCSIIVAVSLTSVGFMGYFALLYYNHRELRKLQRRADPDFDRYSLSRTYQLRENVVIMKMLLKLILPAFLFASPVFIFRAGTYLLIDNQRYEFFCNIITAVTDLWVALTGLNIQLIFPFVDYRFRKAANEIRIFRFIIEMRGMQTSSGKFVRKHLTGNKVQTADIYFHWLENDLK